MLRTLIIPALALALASCSSEDKKADAASYAPCARFVVIAPGEESCGVALSADSRLSLDGAPILNNEQFIVTSGVRTPARSVQIYPSPGGRFLLVRGCEGDETQPNICWRAMLIDRGAEEKTRDLSFRSHYGPSTQIFWSPGNTRFAVLEPMEGYQAITLVNPETGAIRSYPPEGGAQNYRIDPASISWASESQASASVSVCSENPSDPLQVECAAPAAQTFEAP